MKVGEVMVTRDFVNHHDHLGHHVKCLIWVVEWRTEEGKPCKLLKLRHYCSGKGSMSTDAYYTVDVMDFHLNNKEGSCPGLFKEFNRIIFAGDHGVHFADVKTMFRECEAHKLYTNGSGEPMEVELMFLTSYHAYSRADGAGAEDSVSLRRDMQRGFPRWGAEAMKDMTNSSNDPRSWAYCFPKINRNKNSFPPKSILKAPTWLRKWNQVSFEYEGQSDATIGIVKYRFITNKGE